MDDDIYTDPLTARIRDLEDVVWRLAHTPLDALDEPKVGRFAAELNVACSRLCEYVDNRDLPVAEVMAMLSYHAQRYVQLHVAAGVLKKEGIVPLPDSSFQHLTLMVSAN